MGAGGRVRVVVGEEKGRSSADGGQNVWSGSMRESVAMNEGGLCRVPLDAVWAPPSGGGLVT